MIVQGKDTDLRCAMCRRRYAIVAKNGDVLPKARVTLVDMSQGRVEIVCCGRTYEIVQNDLDKQA